MYYTNMENLNEQEREILDHLVSLAEDNPELVEEAFHRCWKPVVKRNLFHKLFKRHGKYTGEKQVDIGDVESYILGNRW